MKKEIELSVMLFDDGEVEIDNSNFSEQTYTKGTINFIGEVDGRRKYYDPLLTMEKAGLVTRVSDKESMFSEYKATKLFKDKFVPKAMHFDENMVERMTSKVNEAINLTPYTEKQGWNLLANKQLSNIDVYQKTTKQIAELLN